MVVFREQPGSQCGWNEHEGDGRRQAWEGNEARLLRGLEKTLRLRSKCNETPTGVFDHVRRLFLKIVC